MRRAIEAVIDEDGQVRLLEPVDLQAAQRVLVIVEEPSSSPSDVTLLSEDALAEDWDRPEEEAAWSHLRTGKRAEALGC